MTEWLISLATVAASTAVTTIIGLVIKKSAEKRLDKRTAEQNELLELRAERERRERKSDVIETMRLELKPIETKIDNIDEKISILSKGEQAGLRHDLYEIYDKWINQGYCPREVKADFENIYISYHTLGKNGVMDGCYNRLMALPDYEPIIKNDEVTIR